MKSIGFQTIYDGVRFKKNISLTSFTLDSITISTIQASSESFANNDTSLMTSASIEDKILSYGYSTTTGDITGVTITTDTGGGSAASDTGGSADFSILGSSGVGVTNSGTTITAVAVPAEIDHDSLNNYAANEHFTQANITTVGTIGTGVWQGTAIASAYLDSDTAHLSGTQSFAGNKTFEGTTVINKATFIHVDGDKSVTPGDGAMIHVDTSNITDNNTLEGGNAPRYNHVAFEGPTLAATNGDVVTTNAATLFIKPSIAGTNQTITNNWGVYVDGGAIYTLGLTNSSNYTQTSGDMTLYHAANDANPTFSMGSSATERLEIKAQYESGAQGLDVVKFVTHTAGSGSDDGRYAFQVDETFIFNILDAGVRIKASGNLEIGSGNTILSDSSGTTTLSNIDALDATTESTIETAIDTLSNLTTVGTIGTGVWNGTKITDIYTNSSGKRYGNTIKILPSDFMINEDAAVPLSFKDGGNSGVHINDTANEALAFVTIPEGMKATHVDVYATHNRTLKVWEVDLNASFDFTSTTKGTGACNTQLDITDVNATATNYLAIQVALSATTQRIWGGVVTIAAQ